MSSDGSQGRVGDMVGWAHTTLRENHRAASQYTNSKLAATPLMSMGSFVEGPAGAIDVPEMERWNMSLAEGEQCELDDFWGLVANQVEQAEATAAMEREDQRSQDVRARIKKEERYKIWEKEDLRKKETRSVVRENLEDAARREYLEIFYSEPTVDMAMNYSWPTRATLGQALSEQSLDSFVDGKDVVSTAVRSGGDSLCSTTRGGSRGGDNAVSAPSTAQTSRDIYNEWNASRSSGGTLGESSRSTRPFHVFRGKKAHQIIPVQDCFIPPRHLTEPTTKYGLVPVHGLATASCSAGGDVAARPIPLQPPVDAPAGLSKAVHLPPMIETQRDRLAVGSAGSNTTTGSREGRSSLKKRFLTGEISPRMSSFERKFSTRREQWFREEEADAQERALQEQRRTQELLRAFENRGGHGKGWQGYGYKIGASTRIHSQQSPTGGVCHTSGSSTRIRKRQAWSRDWRDNGESRGDGEKVAELVPEREEQLLTQMFDMLDVRSRGEVRLDEVLFFMTEKAQVKSLLKQVTLWTLIKTRRWEWVEELLAAQPTRTLTLSALLEFSRSLYEESGVPRKHLRLARAVHGLDVERKDARSRRLLPADLVNGSEVEALFQKGFAWYRAWIVKCHPNDTFDVRFTRPRSSLSEDATPRKGTAAAREERPEVETSSQVSGSEEDWDTDEENSALEAEKEWKATCVSVAQFIGGRIGRRVGIPPDLGRTETEVLGDAFDAIANLVSPPQARPTQATDGNVATSDISGSEGQGRPGGGKENTDGVCDRTPGAGVLETPRIPAGEIIRILRAGAVDEYRRASPALSAACIYKEFAEGLGAATIGSRLTEDTARRKTSGNSTDEDDHHNNRGSRHPHQGDAGGEDIDEDSRGRGVSREEFCDYFEAVTDLVDVNDLNLVPTAVGV